MARSSNIIMEDLCPECGGKVIRRSLPRYDFCEGKCNILLNIPSKYRPDKKIGIITWRAGDESQFWQKMTREHYVGLCVAVKQFYEQIRAGEAA